MASNGRRSVTPVYNVSWPAPSAYVQVYVGLRGLETPYLITAGSHATVLIPRGQCLYATDIDAKGAVSARSQEVCPGFINPPTHILVTMR